jgi:hypothetical protein
MSAHGLQTPRQPRVRVVHIPSGSTLPRPVPVHVGTTPVALPTDTRPPWERLEEAIFKRDVSLVKKILSTETLEINLADIHGTTLLMMACQVGNLSIVNALLGVRGINIVMKNSAGGDALAIASLYAHPAVVRELRERIRSLKLATAGSEIRPTRRGHLVCSGAILNMGNRRHGRA